MTPSADGPQLRVIDGGMPDSDPASALAELVRRTARGDEAAFEQLYDRCAGQVLGLVRRVLRDPAQSEEVAQEVLVEVWRQATRYDETKGAPLTWILTIAHRRAVDRVRSAQASTERDARIGIRDAAGAEYDHVADEVATRLEHEQVRRCLDGLTDLQRESLQLAYYGGYTQTEVAALLEVPLGTVKTRVRDGLIRLRDCMGVTA
ncbi:MAG: sigma-70 family RNA polymerase sigma factor [Actinomycetales bacterium]